MSKYGSVVILVPVAMLLLLAVPVLAADAPRPPHRVIQELYRNLASHRPPVPNAEAIESARQAIRNYIVQGGDPKHLTDLSGGATPLHRATLLGFVEIVEELLRYPAVVVGVNDGDAKGISPWMHANFAWNQSAWLCHPALFDDAPRMLPLMFIQPYYLGDDPSPYVRTRRLLEGAGATPALQEAKQVWQQQCPNQSGDTAKKVAASTDLLETLRVEGGINLKSVLLARMKAPQKP